MTHPLDIDGIARQFHETYERLAPTHGYETRDETRKPWNTVPANNKELMRSVVQDLIERGVIVPGNQFAISRFLG
jgi:hypothetical protein